MASKVSAFESLRVLTLPDVRVALWIKLEIEPALFLENGRKPRVVAPVRFHNHGIVWLLLAQKFIDGVLPPAWVPVGPQFRSVLADPVARCVCAPLRMDSPVSTEAPGSSFRSPSANRRESGFRDSRGIRSI